MAHPGSINDRGHADKTVMFAPVPPADSLGCRLFLFLVMIYSMVYTIGGVYGNCGNIYQWTQPGGAIA